MLSRLKAQCKSRFPHIYSRATKPYWLMRRAFSRRIYAFITWFITWFITNRNFLLFSCTLVVYPLFALISWVRIIYKKVFHLKPSVVWGPTPILNIRDNSLVLKRLGYKSTTVVYTTYYITRDFDIVLEKYFYNPKMTEFVPPLTFLWSLLHFDIFHFFYDGGFWSGMKICPYAKWLEIPLLRLAGKRVIAMAYGADVRTRERNESWTVNICQECPEPTRHCICDDDSAAKNIRHYRYWANACIAMGDMHDYVDGSQIDFFHWPIDTDVVKAVGVKEHDTPLKLVHSPNHRHFKGTRFIEQSVRELQAKGHDIELILVEKVSNEEAKRRYAEADIVIPQCICGWMGFTEIEAMAMGKPVVGYIRDPKYVIHAPGCPLVSATPDRLTAELEKLVASFELRQDLGRRGREWVERYWSYKALMPQYDNLHKKVWKNNALPKLIFGKMTTLLKGDAKSCVPPQ